MCPTYGLFFAWKFSRGDGDIIPISKSQKSIRSSRNIGKVLISRVVGGQKSQSQFGNTISLIWLCLNFGTQVGSMGSPIGSLSATFSTVRTPGFFLKLYFVGGSAIHTHTHPFQMAFGLGCIVGAPPPLPHLVCCRPPGPGLRLKSQSKVQVAHHRLVRWTCLFEVKSTNLERVDLNPKKLGVPPGLFLQMPTWICWSWRLNAENMK